jgi:hypothetical protein
MSSRTQWTTAVALSLFFAVAFAEEGVPPSEWTPQEQKMVQEARAMSAKRNLPFTDEQATVFVKTMREKMAQMMGGMAGLRAGIGAMQETGGGAAPSPGPTQQLQSAPARSGGGGGGSSEDDIRARYEAIPPKSGDATIEGRSDGFVINGKPFLDPEGTITDYAFDAVSGNIGYVMDGGGGKTIKVTRVGSTGEPLKVATVRESTDSVQVSTTSGKNIGGKTFSVTPTGVLVSRASAAFLYVTGRELITFAVPDGYLLATYQHGDVASTGYALLEKDPSSPASRKGLYAAFKDLAPLGRKEDYALVNFVSGKLYPFDIPLFAKNVSVGENCVRMNALMNKCASMKRSEALYTPDGDQNEGHYYWRVTWMNTPAGPIAVALENDLANLNLLDLNSGKKVSAFARAMGINSYDVKQSGDGTVSITARLGFKRDEIKDAVAFLQSAPALPEKPAKK